MKLAYTILRLGWTRVCLALALFSLTLGAALSLPPPPEAAINHLEHIWVKQYTTYLGNPAPRVFRSPGHLQQTLGLIEQQSGVPTAYIYLMSQPQRLQLILVTAQGQPVVKYLPAVDQKTLMGVVEKFRQAVSDPRQFTDYKTPGQQLYDWLIAPLMPQIKAHRIRSLVICAGAGLRSLPFAALWDGQGFLVQSYSLSLVPAYNLVLAPRLHRPLEQAPVLAMGAADFPNQTGAPLPFVPLELAMATHTQGGKFFLNQAFTPTNLQTQIRDFPYLIVHLATHGQFLPGAVQNSYIQFWDRRLDLEQLPAMDLGQLPADLLVLSACETALGNQQAELGFAGLAVQGRVRSALGSLWFISDQGTFALMSAFYHHLHEGPLKAQALQAAQLDLLQGRVTLERGQLVSEGGAAPLPGLAQAQPLDLTHPYYWAPFTLVGSSF